MKRIKLLLAAAVMLMASASFGQTEKTVSKIAEGTALTDGDIGFLTMVSGAAVEASRGNGVKTASVAGSTFKAGDVLTAAQAKALNKAIKNFQKTYKTPDASRGAGLCYYWYYYCDGWGYCYWYKYWYYC